MNRRSFLPNPAELVASPAADAKSLPHGAAQTAVVRELFGANIASQPEQKEHVLDKSPRKIVRFEQHEQQRSATQGGAKKVVDGTETRSTAEKVQSLVTQHQQTAALEANLRWLLQEEFAKCRVVIVCIAPRRHASSAEADAEEHLVSSVLPAALSLGAKTAWLRQKSFPSCERFASAVKELVTLPPAPGEHVTQALAAEVPASCKAPSSSEMLVVLCVLDPTAVEDGLKAVAKVAAQIKQVAAVKKDINPTVSQFMQPWIELVVACILIQNRLAERVSPTAAADGNERQAKKGRTEKSPVPFDSFVATLELFDAMLCPLCC